MKLNALLIFASLIFSLVLGCSAAKIDDEESSSSEDTSILDSSSDEEDERSSDEDKSSADEKSSDEDKSSDEQNSSEEDDRSSQTESSADDESSSSENGTGNSSSGELSSGDDTSSGEGNSSSNESSSGDNNSSSGESSSGEEPSSSSIKTWDDIPLVEYAEFDANEVSVSTLGYDLQVDRSSHWYHRQQLPLRKAPGRVYVGDPLEDLRKPRGFVDPRVVNNVLSCPFREEGLPIDDGYGLPDDYTGRMTVYTEGNNWLKIGPTPFNQTDNCGTCDDAGLWFVNGKVGLVKGESITEPGAEEVRIENNSEVSMFTTGGMLPGNEQPGQFITVVNPGESKWFPFRPDGWFQGENLSPERYMSLGGLLVEDGLGWMEACIKKPTNNQYMWEDWGTTGMAYVADASYHGDDVHVQVHQGEGYAPQMGGDPGYAIIFWKEGEIYSVQDFYLTEEGSNGARKEESSDIYENNTMYTKACSMGNIHKDYLTSPNGITMVMSASRSTNHQMKIELVTHERADEVFELLEGKGAECDGYEEVYGFISQEDLDKEQNNDGNPVCLNYNGAGR